MSSDRYVHIELDLQRDADPFTGRLRAGHGEAFEFTGMLELMALIDRALEEGDRRD